ncbi:hypothetical protein ALC53_00503 [Atta colombica]|uniref:Uncharacterized protein n=1 Tax=Atta colombica TaxID=520822 RepID=A0A195BWF8_9HYME|nr:hypothetical protein ALC53_00503 [Atta colombica]
MVATEGENRLYVEMLTSRKENGRDIGIDVSGGGKKRKRREKEPYLSETIAFLGFSFDYRLYLQSISGSPFLVIASFFRKSPLWPFVLRHEVSQDISVAKVLAIMFYMSFTFP